MGISQTKRQAAIDNTVAAGGLAAFTIKTADDPCNVHGLILDVRIASTGAGVSFGQWALVLKPRGSTADPSLTTTGINAELDNPIFWMLSTWMTNGVSFVDRFGGAPRTSRNCPRGATLRLLVESSALSAGGTRVHGTVTWFETIK